MQLIGITLAPSYKVFSLDSLLLFVLKRSCVVILRFRAICLNKHSMPMCCQTTLQQLSGEYADLRPGSADIVVVPMLYTLNLPHFS
jgi:hypothetical protein